MDPGLTAPPAREAALGHDAAQRIVQTIFREVIAVAPRFVARSQLLESLGVEVVEQARGVGWRAASDATGRTNVPGVWVAGNVTDLAAQVIVAAAAGTAAAQINADLVAEDLRQATATAR
jgi:thioredoxin reductase